MHSDNTPGATASPPLPIDVSALVANNRLRGLPALVAFLLGAVLLLDGFDLAVAGFSAPAIIREFGLSTAFMGKLLGAGNAALGVGAILGGLYGDRWGRRPILLWGIVLYAGGTALCGVAPDVTVFFACRIIASLGLGLVAPTVATILVETLPRRWAAPISVLAYVMITVGAVLCGIAAKFVLPVAGWRSLFLLGGLVPLLLILPLLLLFLPETPGFLVKARRPAGQVAAALNRLCSARFTAADTFLLPGEPVAKGGRLSDLFRLHLRDTLALWLVCGSVMFASVAFTNMGTLIFLRMGNDPARAVDLVLLYTAVGLAGGLATSIGVRWLGSRLLLGGLAGMALIALLLIALLPEGTSPAPLVAAVGFALGGLTVGSFPLAANAYPVGIRTRGTGAAAAIGRLASVISAVAVGETLARASAGAVFALLALAMIAGLAGVLMLRNHMAGTARFPAGAHPAGDRTPYNQGAGHE